VIGGNSTTTIWMPSGSWIYISVKPQGSVAGSRMMWTAAAASRACSAWTSRTWIQIITECPGGRVPGDLEQARAEEEHHPGIVWMAELPVDGQAQYVAVEAAAARSLLRNSCAAAAAEPALLCGSGGFGWQCTR
jgi:hypothetical protein